ncbi:Glutamyl-tRNA(Gln) amidotransferase subunit A [Methylobacterium crusticola]|uniref:Glutamyl-tRNA(Gln) amidotransferase subunit A n=1 Tax=Methylobacterium crusticola TaxID=1697972 RepID=A0ABQ4R6A5_9HYPH|nr:amidase [Methylobacterium crusticola]GJD53247.1 Glutamyl-tRNA(Gln) amidotransferase subunit A [Methylobacterium crusticola]
MAGPLHELTVAQAGRLFRSRALSPVELTAAYLARIAALDPALNAFIAVTQERALAEARQAEEELGRGHDRGPMHGIPYGLKDIFETADLRTTAQSRLLAAHVPRRDCTVQARLRAGGGVLLGKQSTWEFALGGPSFDLPWPPARNPWDLSRSPLGSSSGAAAAIAAGLCPAATGSDTGGSIRMPAAACGIAGLKPTYGLVSRRGVLPNAYSYDHCGPMAWSAEDCALMLGVMAGYDPEDPGSLDAPPADYAAALARPVRGLRVGVVRHWYEEEVRAEPGVVAGLDAALAVLRDLGCRVADVRLPGLREFGDAKTPITLSELYALHEGDLKRRPDAFGRSLRYRVLAGALVRAEDYVQAQRWRAELTAAVGAVLEEVDLLVTAGSFTAAPSLDPDEPPTFLGAAVPSITGPFNTTGMPALSVCCGYDGAGLPVGMQIAGRPLDEGRVLALGHAFERATAAGRRRPAEAGMQGAPAPADTG